MFCLQEMLWMVRSITALLAPHLLLETRQTVQRPVTTLCHPPFYSRKASDSASSILSLGLLPPTFTILFYGR
ncbi:hypothetical protein BDV40DRAFT_280787 [Aspergillus tamarii]|uniref:Uncharacterized protein n=1 Tax=Aspergillus tamarii TaxID=41984 RepID=A0A5N6UD92_ASPTM|nr:hypothetical protein BDV40DRAFT_280787 [Aspergillus tamarii]